MDTNRPINRVKKLDYDADKFGDIHCLSTDVLAGVAKGEIDLNQIAINHLAGRGLDENGQWIGFDEAQRKLIER